MLYETLCQKNKTKQQTCLVDTAPNDWKLYIICTFSDLFLCDNFSFGHTPLCCLVETVLAVPGYVTLMLVTL